MTEEKMSPLRRRMIEDMRIREMSDKRQKSHIRAIKDSAAFLGHSPDTATQEELRAYQLHMTDSGVAHRRTAFLLRYDLRAGGDEAIHAIQDATAQTAGRAQRRRGVRRPDGCTRARAKVSGGPGHFLRCRPQGSRSLQPKDCRY